MMEISALKVLLKNISSFLRFSSSEAIKLELVQRYYQKIEEVLKLLKPVLDAISDAEICSNETLQQAFSCLSRSLDELRELFENCHPLMSKVYFVLQVESLIAKSGDNSLEIFELLKSSVEALPDEFTSASLELCVQKINHIGYEKAQAIIRKAVRDQVEGSGPSSESLASISDFLRLKTNQEILIEAVALEKLKENAEQAENDTELDSIVEMIAFVTHMHDCHVTMRQSQISSPVPIPPDLCCPLSLALMTDPVIVSSGQTYERAYIRNWIDLGLNVCPKTTQTLVHTNLIPNYPVKALIASWCETHNVRLPDPVRSVNSNQPNLPNSPQVIRPPAKNLISSSGPHPQEPSIEASLSGLAENGHESEMGKRSEGDGLADAEIPVLPSRKELSSTAAVWLDAESSRGHIRTVSASSSISQDSFGDRNDGAGSDTSGEVGRASRTAVVTTPTANSPRFETRSRNQIWRRSSDRFVPRIAPSPVVDTRGDLSEVETQVHRIIKDLKSNSIDTQRAATAELRFLAKHNMDNRIVIASCGAITLLVSLLRSSDKTTQENAVTALLNLSINDNNKTAIANADAIEPLIYVLENGSPEAKENSAATLFSLSVIEENKIRIGRSGAVGPLVELLGHGTPRGKKDAATALFNLSIFHENKARIVQAGAVKYLVELMDPAAGMVDKAVAVLSNLATIPEGRVTIGQGGGIRALVEVVELGSARGKENAAAALLQLCTASGRFCNLVLREGAVPPLVALSQSGTPRAKEKAQSLLSFFRNHRHGNAGRD